MCAVFSSLEAMGGWTGTASELLSELSAGVGSKRAASARWPKTAWWLTNELRRLAPQLRMLGLFISFEGSSKGHLIVITSRNDPEEIATCGSPISARDCGQRLSLQKNSDMRKSGACKEMTPMTLF